MRARIRASPERLFAERGLGDVTMAVIAKASGTTAAVIYKHFGSDVALFFEVIWGAFESTVVSAARTARWHDPAECCWGLHDT